MKKAGFTLAEILIATSVLGVIAVVAIPSFLSFEQDKDIVARLEAARSVIAQATRMAESRINTIQEWELTDMTNAEIFNYYYKPFLQIGKNCTGRSSTDCWATTSAFNGRSADGGGRYGITGYADVAFTLADGINVTITKTVTIDERFGIESSLPTSLIFMVDVNGETGPNRIGKDVFAFALTDIGILPAGIHNYSGNCIKNAELNDDYWDCCAKVLNEKKRTYIPKLFN